MEFTGDRNSLAEAITNAANGIPASPVIPVRAGMNIKASPDFACFTGSDGDVTFKSSTGVTVSHVGEVTLPGKLLADIIRSLPDQDVHFAATPELATITCGRGEFKLRAYKDEYPGAAKDCDMTGSVGGDDLSAAIRAVIPAASRKDGNPALHGVLLDPLSNHEHLTLVATDRYRVASFDIGVGDAAGLAGLGSCVIPTWAAERFRKGITSPLVDMGWDDSSCTMWSGGLTCTVRQIAGKFADWSRFLPTEPPDVTVNVEGLLGAVKRAQLAADADNPVELTFTAGAVRVSAGDSTRAEETVDAAYDGGEFTALFGVSMLLDGLNGCEEENVALGFTEPLKPVHLSSGRFRYTILPRRRV
jgi:DNA polymerase III subunit beta